jgi:pimeloyl-ACP methyl ester carboxylesterase
MALALAGCPPPPSNGRYLDVGGYYLFHIDTGEPAKVQAGDPTIIFFSGLALDVTTWDKVQPEVAKFARTIAYDRGGTGWSDEGENPRTGGVVVKELRALLDAAEFPGPYVLVAHSLGGQYARLFANAYPNEVVGMVLVDTRHEDAASRQALVLSPHLAKQLADRFSISVPFFSAQTGALGEYLNAVNTATELHSKQWIPNMPLIYLGRDATSAFNFVGVKVDIEAAYELELELVKEQVRLVPQGEYREIANSSHNIQKDQPQAVIQAIRDVFDKAVAK